MKNLTTTLLIFFSSGVLLAQSEKYQQVMEKNIAILDTASTAETFYVLLGSFERISNAEKDQWLPYYYAAYSAINLAGKEKDLNLIDTKVNKADQLIHKADSLSPQNSEIYCLKALSAFAKIKVDFMSRGPKFGELAKNYLLEAQQLNANNPRVYLLLGQYKYGTPPQFGGDKTAGCKFIEKASELFDSQTVKSIDPRWGRSELESYSKACTSLQASNKEE